MSKIFYYLRAAFTYILSIVMYMLGGFDSGLTFLFLLVVFDVLSGVLCAVYGVSMKTESGYLSSSEVTRGVVKKVAIFLLVAVSTAVDRYLGVCEIRTVVVAFLCGGELLSILENMGELGVKYPEKLKEMVEVLRGDGNGNNS